MCDTKKHLSGLKKHMQFQLYHIRSIFELHIEEPKLRASCESATAVSKLRIVSCECAAAVRLVDDGETKKS